MNDDYTVVWAGPGATITHFVTGQAKAKKDAIALLTEQARGSVSLSDGWEILAIWRYEEGRIVSEDLRPR